MQLRSILLTLGKVNEFALLSLNRRIETPHPCPSPEIRGGELLSLDAILVEQFWVTVFLASHYFGELLLLGGILVGQLSLDGILVEQLSLDGFFGESLL